MRRLHGDDLLFLRIDALRAEGRQVEHLQPVGRDNDFDAAYAQDRRRPHRIAHARRHRAFIGEAAVGDRDHFTLDLDRRHEIGIDLAAQVQPDIAIHTGALALPDRFRIGNSAEGSVLQVGCNHGGE